MIMLMTKHAQIRANKRGITDDAIKIIETYGTCENAPGGAIRIILNNKQYQKIISELKKSIQYCDRAKNGALIVKDNHILTVYKREV